MKRYFLSILFMIWSSWAYASPCHVGTPSDFLAQWQKLNAGQCQTLHFTATMEITLESPLVLQGEGAPVLIEAEGGKTVRFLGWVQGSQNPGITIRRSDVTLKNLKFKDFLGTALSLEGGENIAIHKSEISHNGLHGIAIRETKNVLIKRCDIHHNEGSGLVANGYEVEIIKTKVHHHATAGLELQANADALHTFKLSKVSFYENGTGVHTEGQVLPAPRGLNRTEDGNTIKITGTIPFSYDPEDPWRLGIIHPREMEVEIYASDPGDPSQGKEYLTTVETISEEGRFETEIPALNSREGEMTAVAIDKVLNVSSSFSQGGDSDHDAILDNEEGETDPRSADTDLDGLLDGAEIEAGLDPMNLDTDGDCLPDGLEQGVTEEIVSALREASRNPPRFLNFTSGCIAQMTLNEISTPENGLWPEGVGEKTLENLMGLFDSDPETLTRPDQLDSDEDGLKDGEEDKNFNGRVDAGETDPMKADSDQDGLEDKEEDRLGTDPAKADSDGDGAPDGREEERGSDPLQCDSDRDGLGDGLEMGIVNLETALPECRGLATEESNFANSDRLDPLKSDSDNDGLKDGEEDKNRNGWVDSEETDPTLEDTDGDGLQDGFENRFTFDLRELSNGEGCSPPGDPNDLDCDGRINGRDLDSDNDGCLDAEENLKDADEDGIEDVWESQERGCGTTGPSASPSNPSLGGGPSQDKEAEEKVFSETVMPSKGGGACQFVQPEAGDRKPKAHASCFLLLASLFLFLILRLRHTGGDAP